MVFSPPTQVIMQRLLEDPKLVVFATYQPQFWVEEFGSTRIRTFPIAENAMVGIAIGAALSGLHPIVHLNRASFAFIAMDQIVNQAAKLRYISGGQLSLGLTIQAQTRGIDNLAAQHEQSPYSLFAHIPGIKIAVPSTVEEAGGIYLTALSDPNVVFVFESPLIYQRWDRNSVGEIQSIPYGVARIWQEGEDVTIVAIGVMIFEALEAAKELEKEGISCTVIDPRTLVPLDLQSIISSVHKNQRLLVVDEAPPTTSMAAEILAAVCEQPHMIQILKSAPVRVNGIPVPSPFSLALQSEVIPSTQRIINAVRHMMTFG